MDSVSQNRAGANPSSAATPKAIRRVQGRHSLSKNINRQTIGPTPIAASATPEPRSMNLHYPFFGPEPMPMLSNEPSASHQAQRTSLTTTFPNSTTTNRSAFQPGVPARENQKRKVLSKRRPSEASKGSGPSELSSYFSRIKSHLPCQRRASESAAARPAMGKPFDLVHGTEGPKGEDIKMLRHSVFVGPTQKASLAPQGKSLRSFASHKIAREQALTAQPSPTEPRNSTDLSPHVPSQVPLVIVDTAMDVDQRVANAPWGSHNVPSRGPNLTVSDSWQRAKQYKLARLSAPLPAKPDAPSSQATLEHSSPQFSPAALNVEKLSVPSARNPSQVQTALPFRSHLRQVHASDAALESAAIQR